jgi:hypothetical protein
MPNSRLKLTILLKTSRKNAKTTKRTSQTKLHITLIRASMTT